MGDWTRFRTVGAAVVAVLLAGAGAPLFGQHHNTHDARALREDPRFGHPFYWAAFVLSGEWGPLDTELGRPSFWERWRQRHEEG